MHPNGAKKNKLAQAIFSKDGPYLRRPEVTRRPSVTPNKYNANNKNIKGAALDVFKSEPKINYKLKKMNNVILYPHHASGTHETRREMAELSIKNLIQYFKKGKPIYTVL